MLDSTDVPAWVARLVELIKAGEHAEIVLLIMNEGSDAASREDTFRAKLARHWTRLPAVFAQRLADWVYRTLIARRPRVRDAQRPASIGSLIGNVPVIMVQPARAKWSDRFADDDLARIRSHEVDVLLRFGFRILRGGILQAAHCGVWSFHHGDNLVNRGGPPGFWETMENWPETGTLLQILTEELDNGVVLSRSWSGTEPFSVEDNRSAASWKALHFVMRNLEELRRLGSSEFMRRAAARNTAPLFYSRPFHRRPGAWMWCRLVLKKLMQKISTMVENRRCIRQWQLRYHLTGDLATSLHHYKSIVPPTDRFWADPHVIERDGRYFIFIEELPYSSGRGHISVIAMDRDGRHEPPVPVLERPFHLSYPFVFEHEGRIFMIPESAENRTISLYECTRFPDRWEHRMNLMENVRAVDATLHNDGRLWWMFVNIALEPGASTCDELFLFSSPALLSKEWKPHPLNPIVSDCRNARPAGPLFEWKGRLYRPAQNCSKRYGYGFSLNRVDVLTPDDYAETRVTMVLPEWEPGLIATHTFCRAGRLNIVDAQVLRRRRS